MDKYINTIIFVIIASLILANFTNRSNFPKTVMIPLLVGGLTKYILGDWDAKFQWSYVDVIYWISIFGLSYIIIFFQYKTTTYFMFFKRMF